MNKIQVENLVYENITFDIIDTDDGIKVSFTGSIDMEYPQFKLDPYFDQIHEAVIHHKIKNVYCDFQGLSYLNSSGIRSIVKWIMKAISIQNSHDEYKITFILSKEHSWQHVSLGFIANMNPALIHLKK